MGRLNYGVEVGHLYRKEIEEGALGDYDRWAARLRRDVAAVPSWVEGPHFQVFVDDYPEQYDPAERAELGAEIFVIGLLNGVEIDTVAFESDCTAAADELARNLELTDDDWLEHNGNGSRRSTLIQRVDGAWTCATLSAIWTLARLGYEPYREALQREGVDSLGSLQLCDRVLSVLPTSYIDVEASVIQILRDLRRPRVPLSRISYVFA